MQIVNMPVGSLNEYKGNPRKNDIAVEAVANSIREFGFKVPVIIDRENGVIAGHTRIKAARKLGMIEIPCIIADDLTEEQIKAFRIADNSTADLAEWDIELLQIELADIGIDMSQFGLSGFDKNIEPFEDNIDVENAYKEADISHIKQGMIWQLGDHRLMCGDSTSYDDVEMLMAGSKANLIITDPPYNVNVQGKAGTILNDNMKSDAFRKFLFDAFVNMRAFCNYGAAAYIFHSDSEGYNFRGAFCDAGFKLAQTCIWVKNSMVMGRQDYQWQHEPVMCGESIEGEFEPVLYGWDLRSGHKWHGNRKQKTVWYFDKPNRSDEHPTMKPIPLIAYPMKNSSMRKDIIMDLFGGSGSTLIACEQMERCCYTMELDPKYCNVIVKRWEKHSGCTAVLLNG